MARSFEDTIDKVTAELPAGDYKELREQLAAVKLAATFRAPEIQHLSWQALCGCLEDHLPDPTATDAPEWVLRIKDIMLGDS